MREDADDHLKVDEVALVEAFYPTAATRGPAAAAAASAVPLEPSQQVNGPGETQLSAFLAEHSALTGPADKPAGESHALGFGQTGGCRLLGIQELVDWVSNFENFSSVNSFREVNR